MPQYLLTCDCGETLKVEQRQAGSAMECSCGRNLAVPTLGQLRDLPVATSLDAEVGTPGWSLRQGVFYAAGIIITLTSAIAIVTLLVLISRLKTDRPTYSFDRTIESLSPQEAWSAWKELSAGEPSSRRTPDHIAARQYRRYLYVGLVISGIVAGMGVALTAISVRMSGPKKGVRHA